MADYKELIRKAIQALPENNGAARRAVYEKARAALVGQLRGLNPPLAARDITQHRLQLEDCIRQVEQEASEAVIAGLKQNENMPLRQAALPPPRPPARPALTSSNSRPAPSAGARPNGASGPRQNGAAPIRPAGAMPAVPRPAAAKPVSPAPRVAAVQPQNGSAAAAVAPASRPSSIARPLPRPQVASYPRVVAQPVPESEEEEPETIEDIIIAAESDLDNSIDVEEAQPETYDDDGVQDEPEPPMFKIEQRPQRRAEVETQLRADTRQVPAIVARAEAAKAAKSSRAPEPSRRVNGDDGYRNGAAQPGRAPGTARPRNGEPIQLPRPTNGNAAMSSVREVDAENSGDGDPQIAIERAIATLEREARNDGDDIDNAIDAEDDLPQARPSGRRRNGLDQGSREPSMMADQGFARAPVERERGGGSAVTIFLLVFLALLVAVGGAGLWAWHEGFIDFDAMFGKSQAVTAQTSDNNTTPAASADTSGSEDNSAVPASQRAPQTNTEAASSTPAQSSAPLSAGPATAAATPAPATAEPSAQAGGGPKTEERLSQASGADTAPPTADASAPAAGATATPGGSQSLLLEASQDGTTGAVPFSGTVEWTRGTDEMGQATLVGKASIPARNLGVNVLIRKNSDPTLPASHLMEINFTVNDSFIGGSIAGLPGVLLKNEELVQGTPLVGASARVVGNSFLFALSSSASDEATNQDLLTSRKWMDLAIIYATGKKAIITLEKDDKAEQLFSDVFSSWSKQAAAPAAAGPVTAASPPGAAKSK